MHIYIIYYILYNNTHVYIYISYMIFPWYHLVIFPCAVFGPGDTWPPFVLEVPLLVLPPEVQTLEVPQLVFHSYVKVPEAFCGYFFGHDE